ncbi:hypothetical protein SAMN05444841_101109 [Enterobacter kobei]|nr:hypothetical protein SAMN05444841_101109 [Enterobacter kobei]
MYINFGMTNALNMLFSLSAACFHAGNLLLIKTYFDNFYLTIG